MRTRRMIMAMAAAVLLLAAGCSGDDAEGGGAVKTPEGGWPQPENGQLTDKMCGLLTAEDYAEFKHKLLLPFEPQGADKPSSNWASCSSPPADTISLNWQPTAESAKIWYASSLAGRRFQVTSDNRDTILTEGLVTGADESWLDYWVTSGESDKRKDYELNLRRGSLLVGLVLSGVDTAEEPDPQGTLVALADRVLQRIGDVGKTDTGQTPMLQLEVTGKGKAETIQYSVPDRKVVTLKNVKLPWKKDVPLADHGRQMQSISINARTPFTNGLPVPVGCRVLADGKILAEEFQVTGFAPCQAHLPQ